jgi:transposase
MEHHVGIAVSLELSSLCVLDATGKVIREAVVAFLRGLGVTIVRVGCGRTVVRRAIHGDAA